CSVTGQAVPAGQSPAVRATLSVAEVMRWPAGIERTSNFQAQRNSLVLAYPARQSLYPLQVSPLRTAATQGGLNCEKEPAAETVPAIPVASRQVITNGSRR